MQDTLTNPSPPSRPTQLVGEARQFVQRLSHHLIDPAAMTWAGPIFTTYTSEQLESTYQTRIESPTPSFESITTNHFSQYENRHIKNVNGSLPPYPCRPFKEY